MSRYFVLLILLVINLTAVAWTSSEKKIEAIKINTRPIIDGILNDSLWNLAKPISDFIQQEPFPGSPPSFRTEVKVLYNNESLFIGVFCQDPQPDKIVARELKSDGNLRGEDNFTLLFDTFNDNKSAYWFGTNPLGMRDDALLSGMDFRGFNESWNGIWYVQAAVVDSGWSIEFEFPFSTFKFHNLDDQIWGINFARQIRRLNEQVLWSGIGPDAGMFKLIYAGKLVGIKGIKRGDPIYIKPFISAGIQKGVESKSNLLKSGLDIKYGITQNLSLDLTFNTDFAQVESDRSRINLSRFPLFFPEKREFFLENSSIFDYTFGFRNNVFYSRRIGLSEGEEIPINAGARIVGRVNSLELGTLNVQTAAKGNEPATNYGIARFKYDLFDQSYFGFILTNKISKNGFNRVYGFDFNYNTTEFLGDKTLTVGAGAIKSDETNGGKKNGAYKFFVSYPNDLINGFLSYRLAQRDFNPAMGFFFRTAFQSITSHLRYTPRINLWEIKKLNFTLYEADVYWNAYNVFSTANYSFSPFGFLTNADDRFSFHINRNFDFVENDFIIFDTVNIQRGKYWFGSYDINFESSRSRNFFGEVRLSTGSFYSGKRKSLSTELTYMINQHISISSDFEINQLRFDNSSLVTKEAGLRFRYDFNTLTYSSFFMQWNNELNEINLNYRFSWQPKIGSNFYIVINHLLSTEKKIRSKDLVILSKFVWLIVA